MCTFESMGLRPEILKSISEMGFEKPTPIQEKAIPKVLNEKGDLVGLAQTGTGKTAAFGFPVLSLLDENSRNTQVLILSPTRELCMQIASDLENYSKFIPKISVVAVYGGASIDTQIRKLNKGAQVVTGTPGRVLDLVKRGKLRHENIKWLVLDEADEMLNMGFKEDLDSILQDTPSDKTTLLFSATMPKEISRIAKKYMHKPEEINIGAKNTATENVNHEYYVANARDRYKTLKRIADINPSIYGIIFCRTRRETQEVADNLMGDGYNADALHGDLSQAQRDAVMGRFRSKNLQLLVATDVAARGLDINELTHVINYNLPDETAAYVHRSGRTGRAGNIGTSVTIVHSREMRKLRDAEKRTGRKFVQKQIPSGIEICQKQLFNLIDKVEKTEINSEIEQFLPDIFKKLEWLERDELIKHFVSVEFNSFLEYYKNAEDLNITNSRGEKRSKDRNSRGDRGGKRSDTEFSRFFINIGSRDDVRPPVVIGLINDNLNRRDVEIGQIEIMKNFSFFEVDKQFEEQVLKNFQGANHKGTELSVEISAPRQNSSSRSGGGFSSRRNSDRKSDNGGGDRNKRRLRKKGTDTKRRRY